MKKRIISLIIAVILCMAMIVPASIVSADDLPYWEKLVTVNGNTVTLKITLRGPDFTVTGGQVDIEYPTEKLEYVCPGVDSIGLETYDRTLGWLSLGNGSINGYKTPGIFRANFFSMLTVATDQVLCEVKFTIKENATVSADDFKVTKDDLIDGNVAAINNPTKIEFTCNHNFVADPDSSVAPTCKDEGKSVEKCSSCGEPKETTIPATGAHTYEVTTTDATCTAEGSKVSKCSVCGDEKTETLAKLPHDFVVNAEESTEATCTEDGLEVSYCSVCEEKQEKVLKAAHKYDEGKVTKEATETEEGEMTYTCSVCEDVKTVAIPKLEVKDDTTTDADKDTDKDAADNAQNGAANATGDSSMILLVSFIAVISLAVIATIVYRNKVRN